MNCSASRDCSSPPIGRWPIPGGPLSGQENAADVIKAVQALNIIVGATDQSGVAALSSAAPLASMLKPPVSAFEDAQTLIDQMQAGKVQVLLVHSANPAYDLPQNAGFIDALKHVPFVVSFSPLVDETAVWADLIMPDRTYLESWGYDVVTPSFDQPVISGQQPVVVPLYDVRSTADVILTLARGIPAAAKAMPWNDEVAFLKETVAQPAHGGVWRQRRGGEVGALPTIRRLVAHPRCTGSDKISEPRSTDRGVATYLSRRRTRLSLFP